MSTRTDLEGPPKKVDSEPLLFMILIDDLICREQRKEGNLAEDRSNEELAAFWHEHPKSGKA